MPSSTPLDRIRDLPRRPGEVWQGDLAPLTALVEEKAGRGDSYCPWIAAWVATEDDRVFPVDLLHPDDVDPGVLVEALLDFATDDEIGGYLPGHLEVRDEALAARLRDLLEDLDVRVECRAELDHFGRVLALLNEHMSGRASIPGLISGEGVSEEMIRAFADAAAGFHRAAPWNELEDIDLIRIETPAPPEGFAYAVVLGAVGEEFGFCFLHEPEELWEQHRASHPSEWLEGRQRGLWTMTFDETIAPQADSDLWDRLDLPLASAGAYPFPLFVGSEGWRRPNASELNFLEALLRALAETTPAEVDGGRWSKSVGTSDGPVDLTLSLPDLLDPPDHAELMRRGFDPDPRTAERANMAIQDFLEEHSFETIEQANEVLRARFTGRPFDEFAITPRTPLEEAQLLCYDAFDAIGRRRRQLARKAIEVCPDCADAYVILAEQCTEPLEARALFEQGVAAGERALGRDRLERDAGELGHHLDARPYFRARMGLTLGLEQLGETESAAAHFRELLRLDPDDRQGARYRLLVCLLELGNDAEATKLLGAYNEDGAALWRYARALLAYRERGDSPVSRTQLREAFRSNPRVVDLLCNEDPAPSPFAGGFEDIEAEACTEDLLPIVATTTGARRGSRCAGRRRRGPRAGAQSGAASSVDAGGGERRDDARHSADHASPLVGSSPSRMNVPSEPFHFVQEEPDGVDEEATSHRRLEG